MRLIPSTGSVSRTRTSWLLGCILVVVVGGLTLSLLPVAATDASDVNVTIDAPEEAVVGDTVEVEATLENNANESYTEEALELRAGQELIDSRSIAVSGNETESLSFTYEPDRSDLGSIEFSLSGESVTERTETTITLSDDEQLAAERSSEDEVTVTVDAASVGENVTELEITPDPELDWPEAPINVSGTVENGLYQQTFSVPEAADESLQNTTVEVEFAENETAEDTVHLHSVDWGSLGPWMDDETLYLPVRMTGVTEETDVSLAAGENESVKTTVENDRTISVDAGSLPSAGGGPAFDSAFETDGVQISDRASIAPEIRYLHGDIVMWHPQIEAETEYEVTVHELNGADNQATISATADRSGAVSVPVPDRVVAAENVTMSVEGSTVLDEYEIETVASSQAIDGELLTDQEIALERSGEALSISAAIVEHESGDVEYRSGDSISVNGNTMELSDVALDKDDTLQIATDAGIVTVDLVPGETVSDDEPLIGGTLVLGIVGLVLSVVGGFGGFWSGKQFGLPSLFQSLLVTLVLGLTIIVFALLAITDLVAVPLQAVALPAVLVLAAITGYAIGGVIKQDATDQRGNVKEKTGTTTSTVGVTVRVTDGTNPVKGKTQVKAVNLKKTEKRTETIHNGSGQITLPEGKWRLRAKHGDQMSNKIQERFSKRGRSSVKLTIDSPGISLLIKDKRNGQPIQDVSVRVDGDDETMIEQTDQNGRVTFDPPVGVDAVTVTALHDKYEDLTDQFNLQRDIQKTLQLSRRTGSVRFVTQIDGKQTGNVRFSVSPDEPQLEQLIGTSGSKATTDSSGERVEDLIVGTYRVALALPDRFESEEQQIAVQSGTKTVTLDSSFTWELSEEQEDKIAEIRSDIQDVTGKSGIDTSITRYYCSVIEEVLDAVKTFPEQGHHFAAMDVDPNTIADATLTAAEETVGTISDAMSTKRNLDLFTACADMADANVQWNGTFEIERLSELLQDELIEVRRTFAQRTDEVSDRIDTERGDLSEVSPVREMLERVDIDDTASDTDNITRIYVTLLLLDAIEALFDHPKLKKRLSQTVF